MRIPILQLGDILLTSLPADLSDDEVEAFQEDVVNEVSKRGASGLVIDITGLDTVDSYMARVLDETATMTRLIGAAVVLSGMQPMVGLTLVEMGRQLRVDTAINLELAISRLKEIIAEGMTGGSG